MMRNDELGNIGWEPYTLSLSPYMCVYYINARVRSICLYLFLSLLFLFSVSLTHTLAVLIFALLVSIFNLFSMSL